MEQVWERYIQREANRILKNAVLGWGRQREKVSEVQIEAGPIVRGKEQVYLKVQGIGIVVYVSFHVNDEVRLYGEAYLLSMLEPLVREIKRKAKLNAEETLVIQTGQIHFNTRGKDYVLPVRIAPGEWGEKVVIQVP